LERLRIPIKDLVYLDAGAVAEEPKPSARPKFNAADVHERLANVQHSAVDHLQGELAILKKYLSSIGFPQQALGQLDDLYEAEEKR
jgi:hypothetical protein